MNSYKKEKEKSQTAKFIVFGKGNQLRGAKNRKNHRKHQDVSFHMVLSVKNFPSQKCQGEGISANKKIPFSAISRVRPEKENIQMAAKRTILILEGLPMAHLKAFVLNFSEHPRKGS